MNKGQIIQKVKGLNLQKDSFVIFGSAPLAALGIREANDIDLYVSKEIYQLLKNKGWKDLKKSAKDIPVVYDVFEAHDNWDFSDYNPTLDQLISRAMYIDGLPFASIDDVLKWKMRSNRPKDFSDRELIIKYLNKA